MAAFENNYAKLASPLRCSAKAQATVETDYENF